MKTSIQIRDLTLKNPVTVASGTAGYGEELSNFIDISKLGAVFTKGLSVQPRPGNRGNRIIETPAGVLNSIGLENVGLERFLTEKLPFLRKAGATVIPNVAGHSVEENVEICAALSAAEGIRALELNASCPNVKEGGMAFGTDMKRFTDLVEKTRKATKCALIVKLSPNVTDVTEFAARAEQIGADAVSAVNTFLGMKIDTKKKRPHFQNRVAGLSGPAIRPLAVRVVYQIYEKVSIPIIGLGGIACFGDMLEFMMAGAAAVSVGTMNMVDPALSLALIGELEGYLERENAAGIHDIIGAAHRSIGHPEDCS
ncbi:MAG TPA: dihydroorotate dehydrogenase [Spirochaetota bacterium]|nr:dihydroorotate dehydrogenase [Spirochaetota bacterium]HPC40681.1 dihydroorotate dehydrogenase [Spirochaetota bacterium]HPL17879.1 dihydroorotate dehydrogenase [Spirochaetota bacterium]HQF09411.1 dihydroorotate dehydrogenase [Spirochaetota bacterium]HQH97975.1 dihydroorotate dehydrogenase [Spirochaetota bacterium]